MLIIFPDDVEWTSLEGNCAGCDAVIPDAMFRGTVARHFPKVAVVDAVGMCEACQLLIRFHYRLHDDGRVTGISGDTWGQWQSKPSLLDRVRSSIGRFIRSITTPSGGAR